ncbi:MAG: heme-copper oxidase subunit III [Acidimicrobiales bacterium]
MAALTAHAAHLRAEASYRPRANRLGLWLFILSETFLFSAFISARYVLDGTHQPEELNQGLALGLTVLLLVSSISAYLGETAIAHDDRRGFFAYLTITIVFGVAFLVGVGFEFDEAAGHFPVATLYGSVFFTLIGLHAFHVLTGVLALAVVLNLGRRGHYGSEDHWWVEAAVKYWHFVDLAWVVIYPTLYLVGSGGVTAGGLRAARAAGVIAVATAAFWVVCALALWIYAGPGRRPAVHELTIQPGAAALVAAGQNPLALPATWSFRSGDVLVLANDDAVVHVLGRWLVAPGERRRITLRASASLVCSLHPSGAIALDVHPARTDWRLTLAPTLVVGPALGVGALAVRRVARALDEPAAPGVPSLGERPDLPLGEAS